MTNETMTQRVNWLGTEYLVKISWEREDKEITFVRCLIDGKEIARYFRGRWKDAKGKKQDSSEYSRLLKCCQDSFKHSRYTNPAITPLFTLLLGEDM